MKYFREVNSLAVVEKRSIMQKVREEEREKSKRKNPFQKCEPLSLTPNENKTQKRKEICELTV